VKKTCPFIFIFFLIQFAQAQPLLPFDAVTKKIVYSDTARVAGISERTLYLRSLDWFALNYNSSNAVIRTNDTVVGLFGITGSFDDSLKLPESQSKAYYAILTPTVTYTLTLEVSDGLCKIIITGLHYSYYVPGPSFATPDLNGITNKGTFESQYEATMADRTISHETKQAWADFFSSCDRRLRAIIESYKKRVQGNGDGF